MGLREYWKKRDFKRTPEPAGDAPKAAKKRAKKLKFIIQKHAATRLHYDFRLEMEGVLRSWAVPKGPSLDPKDRRLAVHVEDHPMEYGTFEGTIPAGQYGGGTVMLWDRGTWEPEGDPVEMYRKGRIKFRLDGEKLQGAWMLLRMAGRKEGEKEQWLLVKDADEAAKRGREGQITELRPESVSTGRSLEEIAGGKSKVWESNRPPVGEDTPFKRRIAAAIAASKKKRKRPAARKRGSLKRAA